MSDSEFISAKHKAQNNSNFTQQELAGKFEIGQSTVADILAKSSYWLSLDDKNSQMHLAHRKILLLVDNCSAHSIEGSNLSNINVVFLPKNTMAWLQPCDARIIYLFKLLLQNRIAAFDEANLTNKPPDPFTIYDAIHILPFAEIDECLDTEVSAEINNNNEETELENLITQFQNLKNPENSEHLNISIHKFIEIDNKYATGEMPTINKLIEKMQESETEEEELEKQKPVTPTQAVTGIDSVLGYIEQLESNFQIDIKVFAELKRMRKELAYLTKKNSKQTKLDLFFIKE
ncbi:7489_t:CDS:2 [Cetraspora pellucida]|uniref:7489_t:CDS:1 n=1 Tax=Cetraspora pellucida TaxID=1433469 RepID=A0A9N9PF81_9GLOM|nr:7489_t:CDS:2 [Cetraspora pellucida]